MDNTIDIEDGTNDTLSAAIMQMLGQKGSKSKKLPYTQPSYSGAPSSNVAALSQLSTTNPYALGHLVGAQARESDENEIQFELANYFGDKNRDFMLAQQQGENAGGAIAELIKRLDPDNIGPALTRDIIDQAGVPMSPDSRASLNMKNITNVVNDTGAASKSGLEGGINSVDYLTGALNDLGIESEAVEPLDLKKARIGGSATKPDRPYKTDYWDPSANGGQGARVTIDMTEAEYKASGGGRNSAPLNRLQVLEFKRANPGAYVVKQGDRSFITNGSNSFEIAKEAE